MLARLRPRCPAAADTSHLMWSMTRSVDGTGDQSMTRPELSELVRARQQQHVYSAVGRAGPIVRPRRPLPEHATRIEESDDHNRHRRADSTAG